jgi:hypothetical protein
VVAQFAASQEGLSSVSEWVSEWVKWCNKEVCKKTNSHFVICMCEWHWHCCVSLVTVNILIWNTMYMIMDHLQVIKQWKHGDSMVYTEPRLYLWLNFKSISTFHCFSTGLTFLEKFYNNKNISCLLLLLKYRTYMNISPHCHDQLCMQQEILLPWISYYFSHNKWGWTCCCFMYRIN